MRECQNPDLIAFANSVVNKKPSIKVLKESLMDQYSPLVQLMQSQLEKKHQSKRLLLPELKKGGNQTIGIFSDYGGESSDSKYFTYTFLICGWNHSYGLENAMSEVRKKHTLGNKEISFKDLGYGPIQRAMDDYLRALDICVVGYLYTVVIEKQIATLFQSQNSTCREITNILRDNDFGEWKPKIAEKLIRIVHIAAYLVGLLSCNGQKIFWMTDHDAIASNTKQHDNMMKLFQSVLPIYTDNKFELIGGAVTFENRSVHMLDLLSAADITAGSLEHYFTRNDKMEQITIKNEANKILQWLSRDGLCLKKNILFVQQKGEKLIGSEVDIQDMEPSEDVEFIGIPI